jgi:hypothetical protein
MNLSIDILISQSSESQALVFYYRAVSSSGSRIQIETDLKSMIRKPTDRSVSKVSDQYRSVYSIVSSVADLVPVRIHRPPFLKLNGYQYRTYLFPKYR